MSLAAHPGQILTSATKKVQRRAKQTAIHQGERRETVIHRGERKQGLSLVNRASAPSGLWPLLRKYSEGISEVSLKVTTVRLADRATPHSPVTKEKWYMGKEF